MIKLQELNKHYELKGTLVKAVDNVNLEVDIGDYIMIVGRSGSGKTTLLSLIAGLTKPTSGTVYIDGTNIWGMNDNEQSKIRSMRMGFVFQFSSLIPTLTAVENIMLSHLFGKLKDNAYDRAMDLLRQVGLEERADAYPSQLSVGQQKRIALARAIVNNPSIILADEPTSDLDVATEKEIMQFFNNLHEKGSTIMIVTHNIELIKYSSKVFTMSKGVLTEGTTLS